MEKLFGFYYLYFTEIIRHSRVQHFFFIYLNSTKKFCLIFMNYENAGIYSTQNLKIDLNLLIFKKFEKSSHCFAFKLAFWKIMFIF